MGLRLGIDLGGTSVKFGLVDEEYRITARTAIKVGADHSVGAVMELIERGVKELGAADRIVGAGIGVPSAILDKRIAVDTPNLDWRDVDVCAEMEKRFDFPCVIGNDADSAALAEALAGAGRGARSMVMLTLGTGLGSSLIYRGEIVAGLRDVGVEMGHMKIIADGLRCGCGGLGCAESYCSATALQRDLRQAAAGDRETVIRKWLVDEGRTPEAKMVFDAAAMGDAVGREILDRFIHLLGIAVSNIVTCSRPHVVVIGGGISAAGDVIFEPLRAEVSRQLYGAFLTGIPEIVPAILGNDAGIIGAAYLS